MVCADVVSLLPAKDNTLYQSGNGISNGLGAHFFTGRTGQLEPFSRRRAVIAFDIAGNIPPDSTVNGVTLRLFMSRSPTGTSMLTFLRRLDADWGEGTSNDSGGEGSGAPATAGDATWANTFFPNGFWNSLGGDFTAFPSGAAAVAGIGIYTWSSDQMVADVQGWLDNPATNYGWILTGSESASRTAKRFDSKDNPIESRRPQLIVDFSVSIPVFACCLPAGACEVLTPDACIGAGGSSLEESIECEGDTDGDGVDAVCGDECPTNSEKTAPGVCGCLVSDVDSDGDGVPDCDDECPSDPEKVEPGTCGCGVDDNADSDNDTVPDCLDVCPGVDDTVFTPECQTPIPTVSSWGVFALALLLLVAAKIRFGRRRTAVVR